MRKLHQIHNEGFKDDPSKTAVEGADSAPPTERKLVSKTQEYSNSKSRDALMRIAIYQLHRYLKDANANYDL